MKRTVACREDVEARPFVSSPSGVTMKHLAVCLGVLLLLSSPAHAAGTLPFSPGEKLTYDVSWAHFVTAGESTLEVNQSGDNDYRLVMQGRTIGFVGKLYNVSDYTVGYFDPEKLRPRTCLIQVRENSYRKSKKIIFDHENGVAHYQVNNHDPETYDVAPQAQGPVSVLYAFRANRDEIMKNNQIVIPLFDDRKMYLLRIHKLGKERLKLPYGMIDTIKFEADLKTEAMFRFRGAMTLWLSDDTAFAPVQMKSKVMIGSVYATLREFSGAPITVIPYPAQESLTAP